MSEDLLIKEKGFRQLNKELDKKANDLMNKISFVINTYSNECPVPNLNKDQGDVKERTTCTRSVKSLNDDSAQVSFKRDSSLPHIFGQFSSAVRSSQTDSQKDERNEGIKKKNLANETIINLFKAKIDVLINELQTIRAEYKKKCDICNNLESENKKYEMKLQTETESSKEKIATLENAVKELQCQLQTLNGENLILKKDLDKLQKQMKAINHESNNHVMRLNRSLENNEKLKILIKNFQIEEKEFKIQIKKLQENKRLTVHSLGKQLSEVIQVLKRQTMIVDNLKKQNACLTAVGQLKFAKEDFTKLLDEKPEALR